jgi:hypothetical protein
LLSYTCRKGFQSAVAFRRAKLKGHREFYYLSGTKVTDVSKLTRKIVLPRTSQLRHPASGRKLGETPVYGVSRALGSVTWTRSAPLGLRTTPIKSTWSSFRFIRRPWLIIERASGHRRGLFSGKRHSTHASASAQEANYAPPLGCGGFRTRVRLVYSDLCRIRGSRGENPGRQAITGNECNSRMSSEAFNRLLRIPLS